MLPTDYQEIGQYLRESRESLRVPIEQAAAALHIRAKYLRALESGDLSELPGKAYMRGYIRTYAEYLGLNTEQVLTSYAALLGTKGPDLFVPEQTLGHNLPTRLVVWLSLIGLILLYVCWYFAFHDHSRIDSRVSEVPPFFMHLLDKTPPDAMDKAVAGCLNGGRAGCLVLLRAQAPLPTNPLTYDLEHDIETAPEP